MSPKSNPSIVSCVVFVACQFAAFAAPDEAPKAPSVEQSAVIQTSDGQLKYTPDAFGNTIPDFSLAGYRHGGVALPVAPVVETLNPQADSPDDSARIQAAIDRVAKHPERQENGIRGAVLLTRGSYRCGKMLSVPAGVTLRGEGQDADGTLITATVLPSAGGAKTLINVTGSVKLQVDKSAHAVLDEVVPLGAKQMKVQGAASFKAGDLVMIERKATQEWIHDIKMDQIEKLGANGHQWTPAEYTRSWQARVLSVKGDILILDTPVVCALERRYGGGSVFKCTDNRGRGAAVERMRLDSVYVKGKENEDEDHASVAISLNGLVDSWVREVTALHFVYSSVSVGQGASRITVQDCAMINPVSQITGGRRYSFPAGGQYVLFQRCYARNGRHDFVTGVANIGPTVYLDCLAEKTHADIGPHHRWSCGQLYDNIKGGEMRVQDRGNMGSGHGWSGNCQIFWNCESTSLVCQRSEPPGAQNWAIGCVGTKGSPSRPGRMDGCWESFGQHVQPRSLYLAQLKERIDRAGGKGDAAILATTTPEQQQGTVWGYLHQRFSKE